MQEIIDFQNWTKDHLHLMLTIIVSKNYVIDSVIITQPGDYISGMIIYHTGVGK